MIYQYIIDSTGMHQIFEVTKYTRTPVLTCIDLFTPVLPGVLEEDTLTPPTLDTHLNSKSSSFL